MAKKTYAQRTIGSQPHCGEKIDVEMPTYYACTMHLNSGAICTSLHSFDVPCSRLDTRIEIYGTEGTLITAPPCDFSGEILFRGRNDSTCLLYTSPSAPANARSESRCPAFPALTPILKAL